MGRHNKVCFKLGVGAKAACRVGRSRFSVMSFFGGGCRSGSRLLACLASVCSIASGRVRTRISFALGRSIDINLLVRGVTG